MKYIVYTDGSYRASRKQGGYAVVFYDSDMNLIKYVFKGIKNTTNNRCELMGFISALKHLPFNSEVVIYSDSEYVLNPIKKGWIYNWIKTNFKDKKNEDLWREVIDLLPHYKLSLEWVKGHEEDERNNFADMLAQHSSIIDLKDNKD